LRSDFPLLEQDVSGSPLVYLDSAATSQKPRSVLRAMTEHQERDNANVHRGAHTLSMRSTEAYEAAREKVANFIHAASAREIVFTRGCTEAINLVAASWGAANLQAGDEVVLTVMEHHSNIVPWQLLAESRGIVLKYARLHAENETLDMGHLESLVEPGKTKLIGVAHVSNTLGCQTDVQRVANLAKSVGAKVLVDACQSVPHMPVDVQSLGADFLVASGHKMLGPTGIGFLWAPYDVLAEMPPWQGGGEMIDEVTLAGVTFAPPPGRFEAGTPAITQAIGLGAACDYLTALGMERVEEYERELGRRLYEKLSAIDGLRIYGPPPSVEGGRAALCAFNIDGIHASDLATFLDTEGFAVRAGHHCTQPLHAELDAAGSARASLYVYNTPEEVDRFCAELESTVEMFRSLE